MIRKICVITGSRADYGLLRWVMQHIKDDNSLLLQIVATGTHLSHEFGLTYKAIESDGFFIDKKVEIILSSDTSVGVAKSMGLALIGFADVLEDLKPDIVLVLGDRFEIFSAVSAALVARIPIAHLHGGEITHGSFDDSLRHSISKMAHIHFVAEDSYRKRLIQLGEQSKNIFLVGALGLDNIKHINLLGKKSLEKALNFKLTKRNLLVTYHPSTLNPGKAKKEMNELFKSLDQLKNTNLIFTLPNADNESRNLIKMLEEFVLLHKNAVLFKSMGQLLYLSSVSHVDGVIGNSSSGLVEAPSLKVGTVNIGDRQNGRICPESIINCEAKSASISKAIELLYSKKFKDKLKNVINPLDQGGASEKVVSTLKIINLDSIIKKTFFDLPHFKDYDKL